MNIDLSISLFQRYLYIILDALSENGVCQR